MRHPAIDASTKALDALAAAPPEGPLTPNENLVPGISLSWEEAPTTKLMAHKTEGTLLDLEIAITGGSPDWLTFNIALGQGRFALKEALGFVYRGEIVGAAPELHPRIRANHRGKVFDAPLQDLWSFTAPKLPKVSLHTVTSQHEVVSKDAYHMLLVPLPRRSCRVILYELRLFWVGAEHGHVLHDGTLASYG